MKKALCFLLLYSMSMFALIKAEHIIVVDGIEVKLSSKEAIYHKAKNTPDSLIIPLKREGNLFFIEANINGERGNFILDLGAPYLVLNATYFRNYEVDSSYYSGSLLEESEFVRRTKVESFSIEELEYDRLAADITDLSAIENKRGIQILGLIGVSFFKDFLFDLNLLSQQLSLYSKKDISSIKSEKILECPIRIINSVIHIKAQSNGRNLTFSLDTGAERNILSNDLEDKVYDGMQILGTSVITDAQGGRSEVLISRLGGIVVGERKLAKMPTLILNLDMMSRAYGKEIDGMLGYPFFSMGRIVIDFKKKRLGMFTFQGT